MRTLHLTLKKKWFDMIESGEKREEYREIKPYWETRLNKDYDIVKFKNGYSSDAPTMTFRLQSIVTGLGKSIWGAPPDKHVFILTLGARIA